MTRKAPCWGQPATEFDLKILVHEPAVALELSFKKKGVGGGGGDRKNPHTFFQFLKGNLTRAAEQRTKK